MKNTTSKVCLEYYYGRWLHRYCCWLTDVEKIGRSNDSEVLSGSFLPVRIETESLYHYDKSKDG